MGSKPDKIEARDEGKSSQIFSSNITHPKLLAAKYIKPTNNQPPYLEIAQSMPSKETFNRWAKNVSKYAPESNEIDAIYLPKSMQFKEKGFCGTSGTAHIQYQIFPFLLSEELINRHKIKQPFLEKQLWYLVYVLNSAGASAHRKGLIIGDIRPQNIFINQDGQIKVSCQYTFFEQNTNYHKSLLLKQKTYLSPEQIKDIQNGKEEPTGDQCTSQCFSLGLTLLSAVLLSDESDLYGSDYSFNDESLQKNIKSLRSSQSYNPILRKIIEGLLVYNPENRIRCKEVVETLKPYEEDIMNLEDFDILEGNMPMAVKEKIMKLAAGKGKNLYGSYAQVINNNEYNREPRMDSFVPNLNQYQPSIPFINEGQYGIDINGSFAKNGNSFASSHSYRPYDNSSQRQVIYTNGQNGNIRDESMVRAESLHSPSQPLQPYRPPSNVSFQPSQSISEIKPSPQRQQDSSFTSSIQSGYYITNQSTLSQYQQQLQQQVSPNNGYQAGNFSKSPDVSYYNSKIDSYIPNQVRNQNQNKSELAYQNKTSSKVEPALSIPRPASYALADMGRNTTSIRPKPESGNVFESYDQVIQNIDRQLIESRKLFPENQY